MAIHKIPQYRYPFFDSRDKKTFLTIKKIAKTKQFPRILGNHQERNQFLVLLLRTQKAKHGWRESLLEIIDQIERDKKIDMKTFIKKHPSGSINKDSTSWVTYKEDKIVSRFIDELATRKVDFVGTDKETSEFIMRFILGQFGNDWEMTIMMVWEMLGNKKQLRVKDLNEEMKHFDYLKLFA